MKNNKYKYVPYHTIKSAMEGDVEAIHKVLARYRGYIIRMSTKTLYDENGIPYVCIDEHMKKTLETKLMLGILKFKIRSQ